MSGFKTVLANQIASTVDRHNCQIIAEFPEELRMNEVDEIEYVPSVCYIRGGNEFAKCVDSLKLQGYNVVGPVVSFA